MGDICDVGGLGQYLDKLSTEEKAIRSTTFHRILDGKRSCIDELAFGTELTSEEIRKKVSDEGSIITSAGISAGHQKRSTRFIE